MVSLKRPQLRPHTQHGDGGDKLSGLTIEVAALILLYYKREFATGYLYLMTPKVVKPKGINASSMPLWYRSAPRPNPIEMNH